MILLLLNFFYRLYHKIRYHPSADCSLASDL